MSLKNKFEQHQWLYTCWRRSWLFCLYMRMRDRGRRWPSNREQVSNWLSSLAEEDGGFLSRVLDLVIEGWSLRLFSLSHHKIVWRRFGTHTLIHSPLVGSFGLYIRPRFSILPLLYYDYIPMLFYAFLWVFWVSSSGASTAGNVPFARRFTTFIINF